MEHIRSIVLSRDDDDVIAVILSDETGSDNSQIGIDVPIPPVGQDVKIALSMFMSLEVMYK